MSWTYRFKHPLPAPYQFDTLKKALKRRRLGVFFEQRVGKTRVAIDFCGVRSARQGKNKFLIISPKSVMTVWPDAIEQYWNGPDYVVQLGWKPKTDPPVTDKPIFVIINYDIVLARLQRIKKWAPDILICDEIQYCKHHTSQRSRAVQKVADLTMDVLGLTGTPGKPENGWFGIMRVIDQHVYGKSMAAFEREYLRTSKLRGYTEYFGYNDEDKLNRLFAEASVRVLREDAGIIDNFEDINIPIDLEPTAKKLYKQMEKDSYLDLETGEVTATIVLTRDLRLHQMAGGWLTHDDKTVMQISMAKLVKCIELTKDLRSDGKQVIIVCRFTPEIEALSKLIPGSAVLQGQHSLTERDRVKKAFQAGDIPVLIGQEQVISVGIDLTAAHNVIFYSVDFNLDTYQQVRDRVMGRAQKHPVTYWHLIAKGTVDKDVYQALQTGESVVKRLVNKRKWTAGGE